MQGCWANNPVIACDILTRVPQINVDQYKKETSSAYLVNVQNLTTSQLGGGEFYLSLNRQKEDTSWWTVNHYLVSPRFSPVLYQLHIPTNQSFLPNYIKLANVATHQPTYLPTWKPEHKQIYLIACTYLSKRTEYIHDESIIGWQWPLFLIFRLV